MIWELCTSRYPYHQAELPEGDYYITDSTSLLPGIYDTVKKLTDGIYQDIESESIIAIFSESVNSMIEVSNFNENHWSYLIEGHPILASAEMVRPEPKINDHKFTFDKRIVVKFNDTMGTLKNASTDILIRDVYDATC